MYGGAKLFFFHAFSEPIRAFRRPRVFIRSSLLSADLFSLESTCLVEMG